jgi:hypothetical protein
MSTQAVAATGDDSLEGLPTPCDLARDALNRARAQRQALTEGSHGSAVASSSHGPSERRDLPHPA